MRLNRILAMAGLGLAMPAQAQVAPVVGPNETLLEVAAEGEAFTAPDRGTITAGVTTIAPTATEAVASNATRMTALVTALRSAGVDAADTRTSMVTLNPNQTYNQVTGPVITGYTATNRLTILLREPKRASAILAAAFNGGANTATGPFFSASRNSTALAEARTDAVKRAREQADAYAAAFGMRIARVIRVSERGRTSDYSSIVVSASRGFSIAPPPAPPPPPDTPVETGQVRQAVTLWVDFALVSR